MARIRAIKPEFWDSPSHPTDPWARLLFIAMWNVADDAGTGSASVRELLGFAFPNDENINEDAVRRMCADIAAHYGVKFYTVAQRPYFHIPSWSKHQKFDKRREGKFPLPDDADSFLYQQEQDNLAQCADSAPSSSRTKVAGTGEQRNRGTGEIKDLAETDVSAVSVPTAKKYPDEFEQWWDVYPSRKNASKRKAFESWKKSGSEITPADLLALTQRYASDPETLSLESRFIPRAETWLHQKRWETVTEKTHVPHQESQNGFLNDLRMGGTSWSMTGLTQLEKS